MIPGQGDRWERAVGADVGFYRDRSRSVNFPGLRGALLACGRIALSHRFSFLQVDLVRAVHEPVEDGVGQRRIADVVVPVLDGELAGDEGGAHADAIVEEFQQVGAFARADGRDREVVDHQQAHLGERGQALLEAAVGVAQAQLVEQTRGTHVERAQALTTCLVGERAGKEGLAAAGGPVDEEVLGGADPVAGAKAGELRPVQPAAGAEVEVLEAGAAHLELGELQQACQAPVVAMQDFALDQQPEALFEGEPLHGALGRLLGERFNHAVELQAVQ